MEKRAFGLRKWKVLLSVFHVIFLVITLAGISAMYLNGGYGKGIRWIYDETYEDSDAFCSQLGIDISNIFTYIGYKDMFETNGVLDMHKPIVRIIDGPGVDEDMTLDQIVRYAKIRGYYLGEDFTVQGSPMAMDDDDMEITVEYKSAKTDLADIDGLETRMTKEEMALDILDRLGKYYTIYYNFISNNTNVRFRILYKSNGKLHFSPHGLVECWLMPIVFSTFCHPGILCITLPEPVLLTLPEDVFLNFSVKSLPNMICPG